MLRQASPRVRSTVAQCYSLAMLGSVAGALEKLDEQLLETSDVIGRICLQSCRSQILYLDCRYEDAFAVFKTELDDLAADAAEEVSLSLGYNRRDILLALWKPDDLYAIVDRSRLAGVEHWDHRAFQAVVEAISQERLFDALPAAWEELRRTYLLGCWQPFQSAAKLMATVSVRLGCISDAVFYVVCSLETKAATELGGMLSTTQNVEVLDTAMVRLLGCTNLKRHFLIGCEIVRCMADAIPEKRLGQVVTWLLPRLSIDSDRLAERSLFEAAWSAVGEFADRVDREQTIQILDVIKGHSLWNSVPDPGGRMVIMRQPMINFVRQSLGCLKSSDLEELTELCLPLALERKQQHDFGNVIGLLCRIAEIGGDVIRDRIRDRLYTGHSLDRVLLHVSDFFGVSVDNRSSLLRAVEQVSRGVRLQVQRLSELDSIEPVNGSYFRQETRVKNVRLVVHFVDCAEIAALLIHRRTIGIAGVKTLLDAALDLILERENFISNKIGLLRAMREIGDSCDEGMLERVLEVVGPIAAGDFLEPAHSMTSAEAMQPLNRNKFSTGDPNELRGVAIYTLTKLEQDSSSSFGKRLDPLVEAGLFDNNATIRRLSYAAAQIKTELSEGEFIALVLGTRDEDDSAAEAAFRAIAVSKRLTLNRPQSKMFVQSARHAIRARSPRVRCAAAYACSLKAQSAPTEALRKEFEQLLAQFAVDVCSSVRVAARKGETST